MAGDLERRLAAVAAREATTQPSTVGMAVRRRWGVVTAVNTGPPASLDVEVGGVEIPGVRYLTGGLTYGVADEVVVDLAGTDPLVIGKLA